MKGILRLFLFTEIKAFDENDMVLMFHLHSGDGFNGQYYCNIKKVHIMP